MPANLNKGWLYATGVMDPPEEPEGLRATATKTTAASKKSGKSTTAKKDTGTGAKSKASTKATPKVKE